jgi:cathepsin A (carboxypeptidase C)
MPRSVYGVSTGTRLTPAPQAFYTAHPEYKPNPFFVFGESYGGHFVPATAGAILAGNSKADSFVIPLAGIGIGNGLTAPEIQ